MISAFGRFWKAAGAAGRTMALEHVACTGPAHCNAAAKQRPKGQLLTDWTATMRAWDSSGMRVL